MIEIILTFALIVAIVWIIEMDQLIKYYKAKIKTLQTIPQDSDTTPFEDLRITSNTGRIPPEIPDYTVDPVAYRCNICGGDLWRDPNCRHWPGIVYRVEQDDGTVKERRCSAIIENAEGVNT